VSDEFDLARFVQAQESGDTYAHALDELRTGRKVSHWMWFVFPQYAGLGRSPMAQRYAIRSRREAVAYLDHEVLGARLRECCTVLESLPHPSAEKIFGGIDAVKLRSSMTLFAQVAPQEEIFGRILAAYFSGVSDPATLQLLNAADDAP
jgi:uncharacterized protein (DUF1810 family)